MTLVTSRSGRCAFCAFRASTWLGQSPVILGSKGFHQSTYLQRVPKKTNKYSHTKGQQHPSYRNDHGPLSGLNSASRATTQYADFSLLIRNQINSLILEVRKQGEKTALGHDRTSLGIETRAELLEKIDDMVTEVQRACRKASREGIIDKELNPLFWHLKEAFVNNGVEGLKLQLKYSLTNFILGARFSAEDVGSQMKLANLQHPIEWYPATRAMHREIHLHVGPTNSGKTYHALQRLEAAKTGIYAGPLRLLAHEVYSRFNAKGKLCSLITGEERRVPEGGKSEMKSCTVEMVPLNTQVDVAVIDEIQMIGDEDRGWAWTAALLGVQAKEVHLCGELRTIELIERICAMTGDKLIVHRYNRLGELKVQSAALKGPKDLEKGDAVILFSRVRIHSMKKQIEKEHPGKRCAVVYGSLPPETRAQQAALFNDPDNEYDFLAASDAVGMGLNLSIKRVIFDAVAKFNGVEEKLLEISDIKQIGGRAGRFKSASEAVKTGPIDIADGPISLESSKPAPPPVGLVTTFDQRDIKEVTRAFSVDAPNIKTAGILPPSSLTERFAQYFPRKTPFSYILLRLHEISATSDLFHLCKLKDMVDTADAIQDLDLTIRDRLIFLAAPLNLRDPNTREVAKAYARCIAEDSSGHILDIPELNLDLLNINFAPPEAPQVLDASTQAALQNKQNQVNKENLRALESLHKHITLYLWLSYRFSGIFRSQALAFHVKTLVEEKIDQALNQVEVTVKRAKNARVRAKQEQLRLEREFAFKAAEEANKERLLAEGLL